MSVGYVLGLKKGMFFLLSVRLGQAQGASINLWKLRKWSSSSEFRKNETRNHIYFLGFPSSVSTLHCFFLKAKKSPSSFHVHNSFMDSVSIVHLEEGCVAVNPTRARLTL